MKKYTTFLRTTLPFFLTSAFVVLHFTLKSQVCDNYLLVPDSVFINTPVFFEVQQDNGSTTPPTLWICNWIDFEANGSHECSNISSCQYTFSSGGLVPVQFEINEPFLNNTEVCTKYIYVNPCDAPAIIAKANNMSDTSWVCEGTQLQLSSNPIGGQSCSGVWQYSWFNGNTFFDGNDFLSLSEVWSSSFQNASFNDINSNRKFSVKVRCSTLQGCMDSSSVYVGIKNFIQSPVFYPMPDSSRCQGVDTLYINIQESNADSIIYMIDQLSLAAGNYIDVHSGALVFDSLFYGPTVITATAYGCDGPKTVAHQIFTHPLPDVLFLVSDSTLMCLGDTLLLPVTLEGTPPFDIKYNMGISPELQFSTLLYNDNITIVANDIEAVYNFYEVNDLYCAFNFDRKKWVLSSLKPVYSVLSDTTLCADASIMLDLGTGNYQYFWFHDSSTFSTTLVDTSMAFINIGSNMIYVSITNDYCTVIDSADIAFAICSSTKSLENKNLQLNIYPNPTNNLFFVDVTPVADKNIEIEVYTTQGQLVLYENNPEHSNRPIALNIERKGLYFFKCKVQGFDPVLKKIIIY